MKCLVCIPSKARPKNIKKFVEPFMKRLGIDYKIFVEPQDKVMYPFENVVSLDANNQGLGYATSFAKNYAEANGYELYFRIDDDVKGIGQLENDIERVLKAFEIPNVGAVVFPYSFEWYAQTKKLFSRKNKRTQTCYIIRTKLFRPDSRVSTFDDFYQYLLLRQDNYDTLYCSKHLIDCAPVGGGEGGLQVFDRSKMALKEINIFKSIDPTIKVISKPDKPWKFEPKFSDKKYQSKAI
jgi:hypothetical protein